MTDKRFELTRRKALAGLGGIGIASAGAGLGTTAFLNDTESFEDNSVEAGTLDLVVDYTTSVSQGVDTGSTTNDDRLQGSAPTANYVINDVKPGDSGKLRFCPKVLGNPGWVYVGSESGVTDYENGQTEPEGSVDATVGGNLGSPNDGMNAGELSHAIQVTVSYCNPDGSLIRELNNPADYTMADLFKELESGFLLDGDTGSSGEQAYPASDEQSPSQQGPCLCIDWELPASVENEIQSDAVEFDVSFYAVQERHNSNSTNPFVDAIVTNGDSIQAAIDAASAGDVIKVESGTYGGPVNIDVADLLLFSPDPSSTTITDRVEVSANGATLCGFTVSPPPATSNQAGEAIRVSNSPDGVTIYNNTVQDLDGNGLPEWEDMEGIVAFGGSATDPIENVTISRNTIQRVDGRDTKGGAVGIRLQGNVDGATVKSNTIKKIGIGSSSWAFGIVVSGTGNHSEVPTNVNVVSNDISEVIANSTTPSLGVGFGVESDGANYLARDNTIDDVNIGVEVKQAAEELTFVDNSLGNIDGSLTGSTQLYFGDQDPDDDSPIASIIGDNTFDQTVASGGSFGPYDQTIQPAP